MWARRNGRIPPDRPSMWRAVT